MFSVIFSDSAFARMSLAYFQDRSKYGNTTHLKRLSHPQTEKAKGSPRLWERSPSAWPHPCILKDTHPFPPLSWRFCEATNMWWIHGNIRRCISTLRIIGPSKLVILLMTLALRNTGSFTLPLEGPKSLGQHKSTVTQSPTLSTRKLPAERICFKPQCQQLHQSRLVSCWQHLAAFFWGAPEARNQTSIWDHLYSRSGKPLFKHPASHKQKYSESQKNSNTSS